MWQMNMNRNFDGKSSNNQIIYFLHTNTDRFSRTETHHERKTPKDVCGHGNVDACQSGNFPGITQKIREGWFAKLKVNVI